MIDLLASAIIDFGVYTHEDLTLFTVEEYGRELAANKPLTQRQWNQIYAKMHAEIVNGYMELKAAENHIWYIPNYSIQNGIKDAMKAAVVSMAGGDLRSKCVIVILTVAGEIGAAAYDEYCKCQEHLTRSKQHFETAEALQKILF
jgi:hypothetical protein